MRTRTKSWLFLIAALILCSGLTAFLLVSRLAPPSPDSSVWTFAREVPAPEQALRLQLVQTAKGWLGCKESDGSHIPILDIYNAHTPLARGYAMQPDDAWCSAFVSTIAIQCGLTQIIPTEVGCEEHIKLFQRIDSWQEDDWYVPLPGDYVFYSEYTCLNNDCTCYSGHVGVVVGTYKHWILVLEGNNRNAVGYRRIKIDDASIRGFGLPDYAGCLDP